VAAKRFSAGRVIELQFMLTANRVQLIGNLGQDPEVRTTQYGKKIVNLSIATSESWRDQHTGERKERTEWHRVVIFNEGLAGIAEQYLTKGAKVLVEGKLVTNKWTDRDGNDRYTTEVQVQPFNGLLTFLSQKRRDDEGAAAGADETGGTMQPEPEPEMAAARARSRTRTRREPAMATTGGGLGAGDLDDEIPFAACWQ